MQIFLTYTHLAGALYVLFLGYLILSKKRNKQSIIFALLCFCISVWLFGTYKILTNVGNKQQIIFWDRSVYLGVVFIPALVYSFYVVLTKKINKYLIGLNFVLALFFFFLSQSNTFAQDAYMYAWGGHLIAKWPHSIYVFWFAASSAMFFYNFFKYYKVANGFQEKIQVRFILYSFIFLAIGGILGFLPAYGISIRPFGNIFVILFASTFAYAIVRYRLLGIRTIISKVYIYLLIAVYTYSFFYFVIFIDELFFDSVSSSQAMFFSPVFIIIFAVTFLPLFRKIQESSDVIFFKGNNPRSIIKDVALQMSAVIDLEELLKITAGEFKKILATEEIDILLFEKNGSCSSLYDYKGKKLPKKNDVCLYIQKIRNIIVRDEIEHGDEAYLLTEMDRLKAKVVAPLIIRYKVIGMIILGEKMDSSPYTKEDIEFLEIISSQAAVAIENARLYQEIEDFNKTLQQKVDEQTKEITEKAEHLKKLMDMRSEFLDITSHQLRTPVTVIKGVLSMFEEGSIPKNKQKEFIRGALDKSIKLGEIINDILRASEMDTDKFTLNVKEVDLNPILEKIEEDKKTSMQVKKKIKLTFDLPKKPLPNVLTDAKYIEQAIVNLVNNSFQYTIEGFIKVTAEVTKEVVIIRVEDSGIGIPSESIPKLFQKFGRAENAVATFTDGSGLGLFIIKQIVDATPGAKIEIEKTELNKGTTFALTLPIFKQQVKEAVK